jgi:copper(I)-binding protein
MKLIAAVLVAFAAATTAPLFAQDAQNAVEENLVIENAFTRPTPAGATVAVGYLTITNNGAAPDRLVSVDSDISKKVEIHESKMVNGVMEMHEMPNGLEIPAGGTVALTPGGDHIMFMDIKQPVKAGDIIHATLGFENTGKVEIGFKAAASIGAMAPGGDMGGMKMK